MAEDQDPKDQSSGDVSRRDFVTLSIAAGLGLAAGSASGADLPVVETTVQVKTPDGMCDAAFIHPSTGAHPGVIIWPDDDLSDDFLAHLRSELEPTYDYVDCKGDGSKNAGVFLRRPLVSQAGS